MIRRSRLKRKDAPASCREVGRALQAFLDGELDDASFAEKIDHHLDECRRCGLEATTYRDIKEALEGRRPAVEDSALARLRAFGSQLSANGDSGLSTTDEH